MLKTLKSSCKQMREKLDTIMSANISIPKIKTVYIPKSDERGETNRLPLSGIENILLYVNGYPLHKLLTFF
jgi:hypothetical protein